MPSTPVSAAGSATVPTRVSPSFGLFGLVVLLGLVAALLLSGCGVVDEVVADTRGSAVDRKTEEMSCRDLADQAVELYAQEPDTQLTKVRRLKLVEDNRPWDNADRPDEGTAVVMACRGRATWSDRKKKTRVRLALVIDPDSRLSLDVQHVK